MHIILWIQKLQKRMIPQNKSKIKYKPKNWPAFLNSILRYTDIPVTIIGSSIENLTSSTAYTADSIIL